MAATEYVLMNQDIPVLDFTCRRNEFDEPEFFEGTWHVDYRPIGYRGLAAFLEHRKAPKHREHIRQLLEQYGCDDSESAERTGLLSPYRLSRESRKADSRRIDA